MNKIQEHSKRQMYLLPLPVIIALSIALINSFIGESIPLMIVDLRHQMQLTIEQAGLLRFAPAAAGILIAPSAGAITDTLGPKRTLTTALSLFAVGGFVIAMSTDSSLLILGLLILGLGQIPASVIAYSMLSKSASNSKQLGIYIAAWGTTYNIGYLLFPPISGWILAQTDRSWIVIGRILTIAAATLLFLIIKLLKNARKKDAVEPIEWSWMLNLGIIFSLTTAIPILDVVVPQLTRPLIGVDVAMTILLIRLIKQCDATRRQLEFIINPSVLLGMLAVSSSFLVDWNYYSERFITLRHSLQLHISAAWLTPANLMGLAGVSLFGILSLRHGILRSTSTSLALWLASSLFFIFATTSTPIYATAAAIAAFTFLCAFTFAGLQTTVTAKVNKANLGAFSSVLLGFDNMAASMGGALTSDIMMNTYKEAYADRLEPLPLSSELTNKIIHWLGEGKFHLVLENDYNIPALVVNRYLLRSSPIRIDVFTSCLQALGYLCLAMIILVTVLYASAWLLQRRQARLVSTEA